MPDIDAKKIEELRGLLADATPGPWRRTSPSPFDAGSGIRIESEEWGWFACVPIVNGREGEYDDANFIVAMRNALPALLDLAERASLPLAGNVEGDALYLASTLRKWGHVGPRLCEKSADEIDRLLGVIRSLSSRVETEKRAKEEAETENARLARLVYVPGQWRCAKCKFTLIQANLNANGGTVTARDQPGDKCPNCDSPLWRVTERDAGNEMIDRAEEAFEAKRAAETRSAALAQDLRGPGHAARAHPDAGRFQQRRPGGACCRVPGGAGHLWL